MIRSMTGFGRADFSTPHGFIQVEIKTVNHKYFDFSARLPHSVLPFEDEIRQMLRQKIRRGKIFLTVSAPENISGTDRLHVNDTLAREYLKAFQRLNTKLQLKERVSLRDIVRMPDVITRSVAGSDRHRTWKKIRACCLRAISVLDASRRREGIVLVADLKARCAEIERRLRLIKKRLPETIRAHKHKILKRLDPQQDAQARADQIRAELATFARNTDISEEIVRLGSHTRSFLEELSGSGRFGRKFDFVAQEMIREINTIGSKSNDFVISGHVVQIKAEIEKIREQAQNVE